MEMNPNDAASGGGDQQGAFTNQHFIDLVGGELAELGRPDVSVERAWIDEGTPGYRFLLRVPVGSKLAVPLLPMESFFHTHDDEERGRHAREFAKALVNLKSAEGMLEKYVRDILRAADEVVATARADGLEILVEKVGLRPTLAFHLTNPSWKEAAFHVLAAVTIRNTSFDLRPETTELWVEEPADVATEMERLLTDQRERQDRIAKL